MLSFLFLLKPVVKKEQLVSRSANCFLMSIQVIQKFKAKQSGCFGGRSPKLFLISSVAFYWIFEFGDKKMFFFPKAVFCFNHTFKISLLLIIRETATIQHFSLNLKCTNSRISMGLTPHSTSRGKGVTSSKLW